MFSRDQALRPAAEEEPSVASLIDTSFEHLISDNNCCAGFLCRWDEQHGTAQLISAVGIPPAPFKGTKLPVLEAFIKEALTQFASPHVHTITEELFKAISDVTDTTDWQYRAFFVPGYSREIALIMICFLKKPNTLKISEEFKTEATEFISMATFLISATGMKDRLRVMETFVREVGHDMASSVQAVVPKLRNIRTGLIQGEAIGAKLAEAESEILSAYQVADSLGITVDPEYNIGAGHDFDLKVAVDHVSTLCKSEAGERHIQFQFQLPSSNIKAWGDPRAIKIALMHLVLNAIKYARGASTISVFVTDSVNDVQVTVQNTGKPLDAEERIKMWDFGWRGETAKELHVNGSGIGLYTVKKIILAHGGTVGVRDTGKPEVVTVYFTLPKKRQPFLFR